MTSYTLLFLTGLLGSFGHCVGMCGGFVFAYSMGLPERKGLFGRAVFHLSYNLGRVYIYALLGGLAGAFGGWVAVSSRSVGVRAFVPILAGVAMVLLGLARMGVMPRFGRVSGAVTEPLGRYARFLSGLVRGRSAAHLFALGLFNGLLPCGLSYAAALTAAGAGGFGAGFLAMAAFGLGTVPAMFALGASSSAVGGRLRGPLFRAAGALVVILGALSIAHGIGLAGPEAASDCCTPR